MNFLQLLNAVARVAKPGHQELVPIEDMATPLAHSGLDSLDLLITSMYLCELYGISQDAARDMAPTTPQELLDFLELHKTKTPQSVEAALREIQ